MITAYDAIAFQARLKPHAIAVQHPLGNVAYAVLIRDVEDLCREFEVRGLTSAGLIGLRIPRIYLSVVCTLAAIRLGLPASHLGRSVQDTNLTGLLHGLGFTHLLTFFGNETVPGLESVTLGERWQATRQSRVDAAVPPPRQSPTGLQWVTFSSGSTGTPKGIMIDASAFDTRLQDSIHWYDMSGMARVLTLIDPSAGPGLWWMLATLAAGGRYVLPPRESGDAQGLFKFVKKSAITHLLTSPWALRGMIDGCSEPVASLRHLEALGSHFPPELAAEARVRITPHIFFQYGSTEVGVIASAHISRPVVERHGVGYVRPEARLEIIDERGDSVPDGTPGRIRMWSQSMSRGYLGDPDNPSLTGEWFYPADTGVLDPTDGLLRVVGRTDELINLGGIKVSPTQIEAQLRADPLVADVAAFSVVDRQGMETIWVAVVAPPYYDAVQALDALKQRSGCVITGALLVAAIPRTENGKVMRRELVMLVPQDARLLPQ